MKRSTSISTIPLRIYLLLALLLSALPAAFARTAGAQERHILVGLYVEQNSSLQPGLEAGFATERLLGGHPRFVLSYSTTRLATAMGSNDLTKDRVLLSSGWHFRPWQRIDPYLELQLGYARYDREDPVLFALLDNEAAIASLLFGIEMKLFDGIGLYGDTGYSILHSSTVYPFVASVGLYVDLDWRLLP